MLRVHLPYIAHVRNQHRAGGTYMEVPVLSRILDVSRAGNVYLGHSYIQNCGNVVLGLVYDLHTKGLFIGWSLHLFCSGWTLHACFPVNNIARCNYGQSQSIHDL